MCLCVYEPESASTNMQLDQERQADNIAFVVVSVEGALLKTPKWAPLLQLLVQQRRLCTDRATWRREAKAGKEKVRLGWND